MGLSNGSAIILDTAGETVNAAIADKQDTGNTSLASIDTKLSGALTITGTVAATQSGLWDVSVNNFPATVAVTQSTSPWVISGNLTNISGTISLPTNAAQETGGNLASILTSLQLIDDTVATTGSAITTKGIAAVGTDGTNARILKTDTSGELQIDVLTLPANASVNVAQIAATTTATSTGSTSAGTQRVISATGATGTLSAVAASTNNVTILAANTARMGVIIYNDGGADLKIKFGATSSATSFTVFIPKNTGYEMWAPCYNGIIDGIWTSATGNARVTEIT